MKYELTCKAGSRLTEAEKQKGHKAYLCPPEKAASCWLHHSCHDAKEHGIVVSAFDAGVYLGAHLRHFLGSDYERVMDELHREDNPTDEFVIDTLSRHLPRCMSRVPEEHHQHFVEGFIRPLPNLMTRLYACKYRDWQAEQLLYQHEGPRVLPGQKPSFPGE